MDISYTWLIVGLVLGTALGLMVMGALVEGRVLDARSEGYATGHVHGQDATLDCVRVQGQLWVQRSAEWKADEQKWVNTTLELSKEVERLKATIEKLNPSNISNSCPACPVAVECNLAAAEEREAAYPVAECGPALTDVEMGRGA